MTKTRAPKAQALAAPAPSPSELLPRHFVLRVVNEDIVKTDADCLVVNHYAGTHVTGAAADVDALINNAILRAAARGELDFPAGRITFMPARRSPMIPDVVAVLSMGEYELFNKQALNIEGTDEIIAKALQSFGRSMAIACCDAEQRDVATVAHGAGESSQIPPKFVAQHLVTGYWRGLQESGKPGQSYTLTLVEKETAKCSQLVAGIQRANKKDLDKILQMRRAKICVNPATPDTPDGQTDDRRGYAWIGDLDPTPQPEMVLPPLHMRLGVFKLNEDELKLTVIGNGSADQAVRDNFQASLIGKARNRLRAFNALVPSQLRRLEAIEAGEDPKAAIAARNERGQLKIEVETRVRAIGVMLYNQIFNPNNMEGIRAQLNDPLAKQLLLRLDEETVSIPWELMADEEGKILCLNREIGRQMELPNVVRNYMIPHPNRDRELRILLVSNPTGDLKSVEEETRRVVEILHNHPTAKMKVTHVSGKLATPLAVLSRVDEDSYDVFHFAGHASFDPNQPSRSGLVMANGELLTVDAISRITAPPRLIFFNACESAGAIFHVPAGQRTEMSALGLIDTHAADSKGSNGAKGSNGKQKASNGAPEAEVEAEIEIGVEDEVVNRFFGHLPASTVSILLRSGITNFIGATWPVEDTAAAEFAVAFYTQLAGGETVGAAMRDARLHVIDTLGFGHLTWASYVLYGVPWSRVV